MQASIHSLHQHAFVSTLMAEAQTDTYTDFWTGLEHSSVYTMYRWSDETSAEYFAWGKNQPDGNAYVNLFIFLNMGQPQPLLFIYLKFFTCD